MKPSQPSKWIRIGNNCVVDCTAILGEKSGRKNLRPRPLILGSQSRIRSAAVLYTNTTIGHHFETGHGTVVREENQLGNHVNVWNHTTIDYGCRIGNRVKIHSNVYVAQYTIIEDDVFIGPGVTFANDLFPKARHTEKVLQGPIIKRGAVIGAHCVLLPGVIIGEGAMVGAGSVVTHDIAPRTVAWGSPAAEQKNLSDLCWPNRFPLQRRTALAFYKRHLSGRRAFPQAK